jgi:peptide/nickel transport system ATP-binding protein
MEEVGLVPVKDIMSRYPHELSGGQRQRVSIASSIILRPKFIVADEPVSMLDMSIRASVLNLLLNLRKTMNLAFLFITHDLALAKYFADRMAIMYLGRIVEMGKVEDVIDNPCHPYSRALISAVPSPNPDEKMDELKIKGDISSSMFLRQGCRFEPRCPFSSEACLKEEPELTEIKKGHFVACTKPLM